MCNSASQLLELLPHLQNSPGPQQVNMGTHEEEGVGEGIATVQNSQKNVNIKYFKMQHQTGTLNLTYTSGIRCQQTLLLSQCHWQCRFYVFWHILYILYSTLCI